MSEDEFSISPPRKELPSKHKNSLRISARNRVVLPELMLGRSLNNSGSMGSINSIDETNNRKMDGSAMGGLSKQKY